MKIYVKKKTNPDLTPMITFQNVNLVITATTTALIAGLFYAWTCSVIPGLARLSNFEYIRAMQSLNLSIQNPLFFASFLGTALLLPVCSYLHFGQPISTRFWLLLISTAIYLIGVLGVTIFGNVPLNDSLAAFQLDSASVNEIAEARSRFENRWNSLNTIRTVASSFSIILIILACINSED